MMNIALNETITTKSRLKELIKELENILQSDLNNEPKNNQIISGFSIDDFKKSLYYKTYKSYPTLANYQYNSNYSYYIYNYTSWLHKSSIGEYNAVGIRCFMPGFLIIEKDR